MNYQECISEIEALSYKGIHRGLDRMVTACRLLGHPQNAFPSIHVAGTNGKGSTAVLATQILHKSHYKTGLTISPHVENYRERIQINAQWISRDDLVRIHQHLKRRVGHLDLTYFEWTTLMAFQYFAESHVDMAIIEVGMGGRWDATNVISPLIGVITNISLDHETYLGHRLEDILIEKLQILKPGMIAWTAIEQKDLLTILQRHCEVNHVTLFNLEAYFHDHEDDRFSLFEHRGLQCSLKGLHQKRNAGLAVAVAKSLIDKGYHISNRAITDGLTNVHWPARLETCSLSPYVLIDAAHNVAGIKTLANFLKGEKRMFHLVYGTLNDRPFKEMLRPLIPYAQTIHWAHFEGKRALTIDDLKQHISELSIGVEHSLLQIKQSAWRDFYKRIGPDESILVTGSLYLVSQVRALIKQSC